MVAVGRLQTRHVTARHLQRVADAGARAIDCARRIGRRRDRQRLRTTRAARLHHAQRTHRRIARHRQRRTRVLKFNQRCKIETDAGTVAIGINHRLFEEYRIGRHNLGLARGCRLVWIARIIVLNRNVLRNRKIARTTVHMDRKCHLLRLAPNPPFHIPRIVGEQVDRCVGGRIAQAGTD